MIDVIYGGSGCGKTTAILEKIKEITKNDDGKMIFYILPDQYTFEAEKRLSKLYSEGLVDPYARITVLSFNSLARLILAHKGNLNTTVVDSVGKSIMTYEAVKNAKRKLNLYGNLYKNTTFIKSISSIISEMKQYDVGVDDLERMMEDMNYINSKSKNFESLDLKMGDVAEIYKEYEKILSRNWIESTDIITQASVLGRDFHLIDGAYFFIDEFTGFTPNQYKLLDLIMEKSSYMSIALTLYESNTMDRFRNGASIFSRSINTFNNIKERALSFDKEFRAYNCGSNSRRTSREDLIFLEKNYNTYPYDVYEDEVKSIEIAVYNDMYQEVEGVAKEIQRLVSKEGYRYRDIAITVRQMENYDYIIQSIFNEYSIPFFLDKKIKASDNPLSLLVSSFLDIVEKNFRREDVISFLKNGLIDTDDDVVFFLENFAIENNITGNKWFKNFTDIKTIFNIDYDLDGSDEEEIERLEEIDSIKKTLIEPIKTYSNSMKKARTATEKSKVIYDFLVAMNVDKTLLNIASNAQMEENNTRMLEYLQIWDKFIDSIDQIVEICGDKEVSFSDFKAMMEICFSSYEVGVVPLGADQLMISSISRFKSDRAKVVFTLGVNEGVIPQKQKENNIIGDREREILRDLGVVIDYGSTYKLYDEEFLIYKLLTSAVDKLILSYPLTGRNDRALRPSSILTRIKRIFPMLREIDYTDVGIQVLDSFDEKGISQFKKISDKVFEKIISALNFDNSHRMLDRMLAMNLFKSKDLSTTKVNTFYSCPYKYFIDYGIKAKKRREYKFDYSDMGSLVHKILEIFDTNVMSMGIEWDDLSIENIDEGVDEILESILNKIPDYILNRNKRYEYSAHRYASGLKESLWWAKEQISAGDLKPSFHELEFSNKGKIGPLKIHMDGRDDDYIRVSGKIDRVDTNESEKGLGIRVVDYKTGSNTFSIEDIYNESNFQLVIYMSALLKNLKKDAYPIASYYNYVKDEVLSSDVDYDMDNDELEKLRAKAYQPRGFFVDLDKNLNKLDSEAEAQGNSKYFNFKRKKNGEFYDTNIISNDEFAVLEDFVEYKISQMYRNTTSGVISVSPKKENSNSSSKLTSCTYCDYQAICKFDEKLRGNNLREPKKIIDDFGGGDDNKRLSTSEKISFMKKILSDVDEEKGGRDIE